MLLRKESALFKRCYQDELEPAEEEGSKEVTHEGAERECQWDNSSKSTKADTEAGQAITEYSWSDGKRTVSIYIELDGLDEVADDAMAVESGEKEVTFTISALAGRKRVFSGSGLYAEIDGVEVDRRRGKNAVVLKLQEREEKSWYKLIGGPGDVDFAELARCAEGFNGAQFEAVCMVAGMEGLRRGASELCYEDYMTGINTVRAVERVVEVPQAQNQEVSEEMEAKDRSEPSGEEGSEEVTYENCAEGKYQWDDSSKGTDADTEVGQAITKYSWSDGKKTVSIYIELDGLDGVADDAMTVESGERRVTFTILALAGRKRVFSGNGLYAEIDGVKVNRRKGKNTVVLKLRRERRRAGIGWSRAWRR